MDPPPFQRFGARAQDCDVEAVFMDTGRHSECHGLDVFLSNGPKVY